jgi:hypothetical protein
MEQDEKHKNEKGEEKDGKESGRKSGRAKRKLG